MRKLMNKAQMEMVKVMVKGRAILAGNSGEGMVDSAVFSVLRCYDRIATLRKRVNNKMNRVRFRANELMNRSKVVLLDQRGEGTVSQAITILTAVVLGSLLLMGLYKLIGDVVLPELQERIMEMFNYGS
tara:strand:+ start:31 stop:417 length:387 start_codon:yes stop_codon:yes gene_type:complete